MITIDANLVLQTQYTALNTRRINQKAYGSVDSYPEDYATKSATDTNNVSDSNDINTGDIDLDALLKELKLEIPANRFSLLLNMKREDLVSMLFLLDKDKLGLGLKYFTKDKLYNYISTLPKEEIIKIVTQMFSKEELLSMVPMKELYKFLDNVKLEPGELMKVMKTLSPNVLAQLYEAATGNPAGKMNYDQYMQKFDNMDPKIVMESFKSLPYKELMQVMNKFVNNNPKLLMQFSTEALCQPLLESAKSRITESMQVLDPEFLIKLVGQLPDKLLANVDCLLDPQIFSDLLLKNNKNLLLSAVS